MKNKFAYLFIALLFCSASAVHAQFTQARLQVAGLNCALCSKTTERELRALPFVSDVKPDLMHNIYVITFKADQPVSFDDISKVVRDENFFISFLKTTVNFDGVKLNGDVFTNGNASYRLINPSGKSLSGQLELTLVDKGFAPRAVSKKYLGTTTGETLPAGKLYHLAI